MNVNKWISKSIPPQVKKENSASDNGETRDGWDKYYMTKYAVLCLKICDEIGYPVSDETRRRCERMKLCYSYYEGKPDEGCGFSTLAEDGFPTDLCILDDEAEAQTFADVRERRAVYNTRSLAVYLAETEDIDPEHIARCEANLADVKLAGKDAIAKIIKRSGQSVSKAYNQERIDTIRKLTGCEE